MRHQHRRTGPCTDSYNSNSGPYSTTNSSATGGNITTNGFVNLNGGAVDGTIYTSLSTVAGSSCPTDGVNKGAGGTVGAIATASAVSRAVSMGLRDLWGQRLRTFRRHSPNHHANSRFVALSRLGKHQRMHSAFPGHHETVRWHHHRHHESESV